MALQPASSFWVTELHLPIALQHFLTRKHPQSFFQGPLGQHPGFEAGVVIKVCIIDLPGDSGQVGCKTFEIVNLQTPPSEELAGYCAEKIRQTGVVKHQARPGSRLEHPYWGET